MTWVESLVANARPGYFESLGKRSNMQLIRVWLHKTLGSDKGLSVNTLGSFRDEQDSILVDFRAFLSHSNPALVCYDLGRVEKISFA